MPRPTPLGVTVVPQFQELVVNLLEDRVVLFPGLFVSLEIHHDEVFTPE
jgi:hypothetical protein